MFKFKKSIVVMAIFLLILKKSALGGIDSKKRVFIPWGGNKIFLGIELSCSAKKKRCYADDALIGKKEWTPVGGYEFFQYPTRRKDAAKIIIRHGWSE